MARRQIVGLLLGLCLAAGCSSTESDDAEAETESTATGTSNGETVNTNGASSSLTATHGASTSASVVTTTTSGTTTGVGGAAGNANATSETSTTAAGGSGGGDVPCPSEAPAAGSECSGASYCVYEDCTGAGRSIATCSESAWSVSTTACSETFTCLIGGGQCNAGEICLIHAGGAISQRCVPNTCGTGPVECDCAEGCFDYCRVEVSPEQGITVICNTCPVGQCA